MCIKNDDDPEEILITFGDANISKLGGGERDIR